MSSDPRIPPQLVFHTLEAERNLSRWINRRGSARGISAASAGVLFHVAGNPDAATGEVAEAIHSSAAGTSGLLARMEKAGFITRTTDPDDRRTIRVSLAPEGAEAMDEVRSAIAELDHLVTDGFSAQELETVARWLKHVADSVG